LQQKIFNFQYFLPWQRQPKQALSIYLQLNIQLELPEQRFPLLHLIQYLRLPRESYDQNLD
jgi:hypothetical protein